MRAPTPSIRRSVDLHRADKIVVNVKDLDDTVSLSTT